MVTWGQIEELGDNIMETCVEEGTHRGGKALAGQKGRLKVKLVVDSWDMRYLSNGTLPRVRANRSTIIGQWDEED